MGSGDDLALIEADDPVAVTQYILARAGLVDQGIWAVTDNEEIGQALLQM